LKWLINKIFESITNKFIKAFSRNYNIPRLCNNSGHDYAHKHTETKKKKGNVEEDRKKHEVSFAY